MGNFETTRNVTGSNFGVDNPSSDQMLIVGAAGSNVLLRIISATDIALDVDKDGDGFDAGDSTLNSTWDDLYAAVSAL